MKYEISDNINTIVTKKSQQNEYNILKAHHKFLWNENSDAIDTTENRIAKDYHDQFFKEYCISDLTHFKIKKIALRWRTEKEVLSGKGESTCGDRKCNLNYQLKSWEVNFKYTEQGKKVNALVKLRLCKECSKKLNYYTRNKQSLQEEHNKRKDSQEYNLINTGTNINTIIIPDKNKLDSNTFIWTIKDLDTSNTSINKKMDDYLMDLFQFM